MFFLTKYSFRFMPYIKPNIYHNLILSIWEISFVIKLQTPYRKRMMQSNDTGKVDTLTVDWLNIWKHPKKQPRVSHNIVSYFYEIIISHFCCVAQFDIRCDTSYQWKLYQILPDLSYIAIPFYSPLMRSIIRHNASKSKQIIVIC